MNPVLFCYDEPNLAQKVAAYAGASALFVTGRGNRYNTAFQVAQDRGAEVLAYVNHFERPNSTVNPVERASYMGDPSRVPLWGNGRVNWEGHTLTDIRVGSAWCDWFVDDFMARLMTERKVSGAFVDGFGCRLFSSLAAWTTWPQAERAEWTAGAVDLARRMHLKRLQINPEFILVGNGVWIDNATGIDASAGEQYVDGVCIESPPLGAGPFFSAYAKRAFGDHGHRRVLVIADNETDAKLWATRPGVTHVTSVNNALGQNYKVATVPVVPNVDNRLPELRAKVERLQRELAEARADDGRVTELTAKLAAVQADLTKARERITAGGKAVAEAATVLGLPI